MSSAYGFILGGLVIHYCGHDHLECYFTWPYMTIYNGGGLMSVEAFSGGKSDKDHPAL